MPSVRNSAAEAVDWMAAAGGDPLTALVSKFAPYLGIFLMLMVVIAITIHGAFEVSFRGDSFLLGIAASLLIWAYLSVGALLRLLVRNLAFGLSLAGILCSPAFGFVGVGFPLLAMSGFARSWGDLLPLRWYMQILSDQAARGVPAVHSIEPSRHPGGPDAGILRVGDPAVATVARRPLPREAPAGDDGPPALPAPLPPSTGGRSATAARSACCRHRIIYGALYPQPYLGQRSGPFRSGRR